MVNERQLAFALGLISQAIMLGDSPGSIRAMLCVACGTVRLRVLPDKVVARVINQLQERVDNLRNLQQLREGGQ